MKHRILIALSVCLALLVFTARPTTATIITYDPSLGTLPDSQGFTLVESPPVSPVQTIESGMLHQGPTSQGGTQFWQRQDISFNFDDGFTLEGTLKVRSSTYDANAGGSGSQRSGYYLEAIDSLGRRFTLGLASGGFTLNTDANLSVGNGIPFTPFDTTEAQHAYRISVAGGVGSLFIDNTLEGSTPIGPVVDPGTANRVYFGDGSGGGSSETQLSLFRYTAVPEPAAISAIALAILFLPRRIGRDWK